MTPATTSCSTLASPIGTFVFAAREERLVSVRIIASDGRFAPAAHWRQDDRAFASIREQFAGYFAGEVTTFDLPLTLHGTPFQRRAWQALQEIPFGSTTTYGALARVIGSPDASRAVGMAMNRNPLALVLPCHRVVGRNGSLRGYLNGVETKRDLLAFEAAHKVADAPLSWDCFVQGRAVSTALQVAGGAS